MLNLRTITWHSNEVGGNTIWYEQRTRLWSTWESPKKVHNVTGISGRLKRPRCLGKILTRFSCEKYFSFNLRDMSVTTYWILRNAPIAI